jgi:hypothetical protein
VPPTPDNVTGERMHCMMHDRRYRYIATIKEIHII